MNKNLSQMVANLFVKSKGNEDLSSKVQRLRDEIKKETESEDTIFGRFRSLLESFREIIPEEKQRYHAAIKALSTTSKLSRQEIVKSVNDQLEELKVLEKGLLPALPAWRDELKALKAKSKQMKDEISKLREKIARLESEEKEILNGMAARERETELVEKAMRDLFADIGAEITRIRSKVEEYTSEGAAVKPIPRRDPLRSDVPMEKKAVGEQKGDIRGPSVQQDTEWQKKCPMCGGRMNLHANEELWMCYSCAYEEAGKGEAQGTGSEKNEQANAPKSALASEPIFDSSPHLAEPSTSSSSDEYQESQRESSPSSSQLSTKSKTCPVCRKKMYWYPAEKAWRCPSCQYERRI